MHKQATVALGQKKNIRLQKDCQHIVEFYHGGDSLIDSVQDFVRIGLNKGERCIVIATSRHLDALQLALGDCVDLASADSSGSFVTYDAEEILARVMHDGKPSAQRFHEVIGGLIKEVSSADEPVRAFSEMVALLWRDGNRKGALQLEQLWNELGTLYSFTLYCAYPSYHFDDSAMHKEMMREIRSSHTGAYSS